MTGLRVYTSTVRWSIGGLYSAPDFVYTWVGYMNRSKYQVLKYLEQINILFQTRFFLIVAHHIRGIEISVLSADLGYLPSSLTQCIGMQGDARSEIRRCERSIMSWDTDIIPTSACKFSVGTWMWDLLTTWQHPMLAGTYLYNATQFYQIQPENSRSK